MNLINLQNSFILMSVNIWQVDAFNDLVGFLKNTTTDYIVLSLIINSTKPDMRALIKKFIKRKAEIFPNVMFLFYTVQPEDINKISFIKGTKDSYPMMCHIKTSSNEVMTFVEGIDGIEPLDDCWSIVEPHFIANFKKYKQLQNPNTNQTNQQPLQNDQLFQQSEQRKLLKKLTYLKDKADEYTLDFMEDCRLRKKEEEKQKKKLQAKSK